MKRIVRSTERDLTLKKLQLEVERLEADQRKYDERLTLSDKKLRSDVRDWYYRLLVAIVSTIVGIGTFLWSQSYQRYTDDFKAIEARVQEDDARFSKELTLLADPSVSVRLTAADDLVTYAKVDQVLPAPPSFSQAFWKKMTRDTSGRSFEVDYRAAVRRKMNVVQAATDRLYQEDDIHVLEALGRVLLAADEAAIQPVASVNRAVANDLSRTVGSALAGGMFGKNNEGCENWQLSSDFVARLDLLAARIKMPYQGQLRQLSIKPSQLLLHSYNVRPYVTIQCNLDVDAYKSHILTPDNKVLNAALIRQARGLTLTSFLLVSLLRNGSQNSGRNMIQLDGIQLVSGISHETIAWSNLSLDQAYIFGTPTYFVCRSCNLRDACLQDLVLVNGSDFSGSDTRGAHIGPR